MKQYMPIKPRKWSFKLFVVVGIPRYAYKFKIYTDLQNFEKFVGQPNFIKQHDGKIQNISKKQKVVYEIISLSH